METNQYHADNAWGDISKQKSQWPGPHIMLLMKYQWPKHLVPTTLAEHLDDIT